MGAVIPLGLGVSIRWADPGPADFTPLLAMVAAVLVVRFVIGLRLGALTTVSAVAGGAAWAAAIPRWGLVIPTLIVVIAVAALRLWAGRPRAT
jgi:hypothetical protein